MVLELTKKRNKEIKRKRIDKTGGNRGDKGGLIQKRRSEMDVEGEIKRCSIDRMENGKGKKEKSVQRRRTKETQRFPSNVMKKIFKPRQDHVIVLEYQAGWFIYVHTYDEGQEKHKKQMIKFPFEGTR